MQYRPFFYLAVTALMFLILFQASSWVGAGDIWLLQAAQGHFSKALDHIAVFFSIVGAPFASLLLIGFLCVLLIRRRQIKAIGVFLGLFCVLTVFEVGAKVSIPHPKPGREFIRKIRLHDFFYKIPDVSVPGKNSFPSGHCLRSIFLVGLLAFLLHKRTPRSRAAWILAVFIYCLLAGWSRLYLGAHWPSDVLGGFALGAIGLIIYMEYAQGFPSFRVQESDAKRESTR